MKQSIEEGFLLDVVRNYLPIESYYRRFPADAALRITCPSSTEAGAQPRRRRSGVSGMGSRGRSFEYRCDAL